MFLRRYPLASPWGLAFQIGATLCGNGLVVWLVLSGRMTPFELVLLVAIEALLLVAIAWLQKRMVPAAAIEPDPMTRRDRLQTLGLLLVWLAGVYAFTLFGIVPSGDEMLGLLRDPVGFVSGSALTWPLLITLGMAAIDALQDHAHFRRHGGLFFSTPGLQASARMLTLILGGIPFAIPFFAGAIGLKLGVERVHAWLTRGEDPGLRRALTALVLGGLVLVLILALPTLADRIDAALEGDAGWWALGYGLAKFVSELFIVCLPLIAALPDAQASAIPTASTPPGPRSRRR